MLDKATPCESCCSEGTRQRHHYRFPHYPHPRQVQTTLTGLQEAHPVGRSQSKFHSLKLYSHQNQHHREIIGRFCRKSIEITSFSWAKLPATIIGWSFVSTTFLLEIWNQIVENAKADNLIFRNSFIHQDRFHN